MEENRINIGELDTLVSVYSVERTLGLRGQKTLTRTLVATVYAKLDRMVDETVEDDNLEEQETIDVSLYKITGLNTRWQIQISGLFFDIVSIDPISRWSNLCTLTCRASVQ